MKQITNSSTADLRKVTNTKSEPSQMRRFIEHPVVLLMYSVLLLILTWPAALSISTHIIGDRWDGYQMYWNLWWVRHAVMTNGLTIFETPLLFYPATPGLIIHTLHPFGGLLTLPFSFFLGDVILFNLVVIFGFAFSGWGAYLLAKHFKCSPGAAFIAGYVFTFSNYHFAHAQGHLNLVLMQWIPFFFLFFHKLVTDNRVRDAVLSAVFLFLVLLCDHYYFLFCVLAMPVFVIWGLFFHKKHMLTFDTLKRFAVFAGVVVATSGVFIWKFLRAAGQAQISGHNADIFGMDVFALMIPGGHWRFHSLTAFYWEQLSSNIHESSVHVGFGVSVLAVAGYVFLRSHRNPVRFLLAGLFLLFFGLSLGTSLQVFGAKIGAPMPYLLLERVFPFISAGGVPVRYIVISILAMSALAAFGATCWASSRHKRIWLTIVLCVVFIEMLPRPVPVSELEYPPLIEFIIHHTAAHPGPIIDPIYPRSYCMIYQTRHHQPIHTGYLARMQCHVEESVAHIQSLIDRQEYKKLGSEYGFRYVVSRSPIPDAVLIYDGYIQLYELTSWNPDCSARNRN